MSSNRALLVHGLGKRYEIGTSRARYQTFRDTLMQAAKNIFSRSSEQEASNKIWALKDISFEVKKGDVVGIIGRNGAGKSTLLKILSKITSPTEGYAEIYGRTGSLLEVGTGFHPELTGRENIYLSGAILGMKKREMDKRFDEIVAFSGVEKFIDTPAKRFSSGMYVRLGFAVAAHLEPEILMVDEVLAVGDAAFQKKCLGKIGNVAKEGRTILFVSHNLGVVANICPKSILLNYGKKEMEGSSSEVINRYIEIGREGCGEGTWESPAVAPGTDKVRLKSVRIVSNGEATTDVDIQKDVLIEVEFWSLKDKNKICTSIQLLDKLGNWVLASANMHSVSLEPDEWFNKECSPGIYKTTCTLPGNFLNEGLYSVNVLLLTDAVHLEVTMNEVISFTVYETGLMRKEFSGAWGGVVRPRLGWRTECLQVESKDQPFERGANQ